MLKGDIVSDVMCLVDSVLNADSGDKKYTLHFICLSFNLLKKKSFFFCPSITLTETMFTVSVNTALDTESSLRHSLTLTERRIH